MTGGFPLGFSVSGSAAIIFVGLFLAFSTAYTASANGFERVSDATAAVDDQTLERQNTALNVTTATYDAGNETLIVDVVNEGSTSLSVNATDLVVDNTYRTDFAVRSVDGDNSTSLWLPGERLHLEVSMSTQPTRIKIVTGPGVAATEVV
ncbi:flagellar protein FlaF [Haloplanus vescus]|uniref:Flagellar protein FlaF n=1 Tax=Haloplanus vescus TaxID=555874 RepID=A0A1H3WBS0_9EURY|nr:flagellar protein FlaF [Haloplanus vescus]